MIKFIHNYFIVAIVALLSALAFTACSDDKDKDDEESLGSDLVLRSKFLGIWQVIHYKGWEKWGSEKDSWDEDEEYENVIQFYEDGSFYRYVVWDDETEEGTGLWTIKNKSLTISEYYKDGEDGYYETRTMKIKKLDAKEMILVSEGSYLDEDGVRHEGYNEITFIRL